MFEDSTYIHLIPPTIFIIIYLFIAFLEVPGLCSCSAASTVSPAEVGTNTEDVRIRTGIDESCLFPCLFLLFISMFIQRRGTL